MNKLPKEKKDRLLLVALGTGGILAVLYFFVISAQQSALEDYFQKTDAAKEKLTKAEHWLRMGPGVQARLGACQKELDTKEESMAPLDKFKWFYNTMAQFLARHQVKLVDITREPELADPGVLPKFPFQAAIFGVKLSAHYHEFGAFLADFENQFPYMRVQNLEIEPEAGAKSVGKDAVANDQHGPNPEILAITMRVVTLVKPNAAL